MHRRWWVAALSLLALVATVPAAIAQDDTTTGDGGNEIDATLEEGIGHPAFNESGGCGQPSTSNPLATQTGWLPDAELVRGFKSDFFGRSIGSVRGQLVGWTVPMSGGHVVNVHERALPAFELVTANLAAEQAKGNFYAIRPEHTYAFASRTVGGGLSISNHGLGTAIDVNSTTNPYRGDNVLITDMPGWFVKAWTDAGFCWGGDWENIKDAMHFSWMGPGATPGYGAPPDDHAVATSTANFTSQVATYTPPYGALDDERRYVVTDATGNGLADVYEVAQRAYGLQLDYSRTHRLHQWCSVGRTVIKDVDFDGRTVLFGDHEQNGRTDLWLLDTSEKKIAIQVVLRSEDFKKSVEITTGVVPQPDDVYLVADHDGDGAVDLLVVRRASDATSIEVWDGASGYTSQLMTGDVPVGGALDSHFAIGDRDLDGRPDLYVLGGGTLAILGNGYAAVAESLPLATPSGLTDLAVNDYDGDGRDDLFLLTSGGKLTIRLGNTPLAGASLTSWFAPAGYTCPSDAYVYDYDGLFRDDEDNVHENDIDFIGGDGITAGCNPPVNDAYCPGRNVTRGQMAAFLDRALDLPDTTRDYFTDDNSSVFEANINRLAAAGITKGCNPPANDRYCAGATVTRGQMAAFLVRGFDLDGGAGDDLFVDDDGTTFENDIDILGTAGITKGCNPPKNDRYCPLNNVTRAQMASFLVRAVATLDA